MSKLEITEEGDSLRHADVTIGFEAYICYWSSRVYETEDILRDDIQSRCLQTEHQREAAKTSVFVIQLRAKSEEDYPAKVTYNTRYKHNSII